jgi:hypothetical protein
MHKGYHYSFGDKLPHGFSAHRPFSSQGSVGLPNPEIRSNVARIALIGYLDLDNRLNRDLIGFLPYEQAARIIEEKSGDAYWWIMLSAPSIDVVQDFKALRYRFECFLCSDLPNVYNINPAAMGFILEWVEGAHLAIGSKELYAEIERLQSSMLQGNGKQVDTKVYEKHLESKGSEILSLKDEIKLLKNELAAAKSEIARLESALTPKDTNGYVYLLKMVKGEYYKIGRTAKPKKRMDRFDVKLPFEVECEHLIQTDNMYQLERELHQRFASKRTNGEWFALDAADVETVKGIGGE